MGFLHMKSAKIMKSSSFGSNVRRRLSDITNLNSSHKSHLKSHVDDDDDHDVVVLPSDFATNDYLQTLLQENAVMIKLVQEKDKIIEANGIELQKLRINLHGTQLQNWFLAQSNTQMLAELNSCKDKLRALQHELACKDTLNKAKALYLQGGETKSEKKQVDQPKLTNDNNENKVSIPKRGRQSKSRSLGPPKSQQAGDKEIAENKRRCLRKQSVPLKPHVKPDDLEINFSNASVMEFSPPHPSITSEDDTKSEESFGPQQKQDIDNSETTVPKPKRQRSARSQSLGPARSQQAVDKEIDDNKRHCLRRQSETPNPQETLEDLFDINLTTPFTESLKQPCHSSTQKEEVKEHVSQSSSTRSMPRRSSTGRPVRKAAEKVHSYELPTIKSKMRRP